ncbi:hypothetical protein [Aminivibrio sp.]|uniref:hypothetical protein n=1 Tax=Aminivibrio sp. TaxID=1872489 RepID=UPI001A548804|nr:hypothetical protein [Aminivibrio sp.]MBL3539042.1 hypothetical protein [Aminivibrio sp.]MDK2958964.1 hypothetical protein [Synergistaceae bacterium]
MLCLGDLAEKCRSFSFDENGCLRLFFSDHSIVLYKDDDVLVFTGDGDSSPSEAERWVKTH